MPQLLKALVGQMILVGPRLTLPYHVEKYDETQRLRLRVKLGITGWALIHGRNAPTWTERIRLDLWYLEHQSF